MTECLDIVNDNDEVVGKSSYNEMYEKKLTHRIVHVLVVNNKGQVYFQKRAETKSFLPGYYCTSAGGHVRSGESYEQAAGRELKEELGLSVPVKDVASLEFESGGHKRFIRLFIASADSGFNFQDGEVAGGEFLNLAEAKKLIERNEKIHPQLPLCFDWLYENLDSLSIHS